MITYKHVISGRQGLHATSAMGLSKAAGEYQSRITIKVGNKEADCKNVLALMGLGARQGDTLEMCVEGSDEKQAAGYLEGIMRTML